MTMQPKEKPLAPADEIEAMLPWLVTGKLSPAETARVASYLDAHPDVAAHVALAREEQDAAIAANEAIKAPGAAALDRLMAQVAASPQPRTFSVPSPLSVWEKIAGFINSFSPTTLGIAGAAAAVVLALQAVTIGMLVTRETGAGYQTASGPSAGIAVGVEALVSLQPGATAGALTAALRELKATIIGGPTAEGYYRLRLAGNKADAAGIIARAKARGEVFAFVGPAPN